MTHDRVEQLREDTAGGPSALAALLDGYAAGGGPLAGIGDRPAGIAFSGLGSSRYGALTAAAEARRLEIPAWPELPLRPPLRRHRRRDRSLSRSRHRDGRTRRSRRRAGIALAVGA